ncbi:DUF6886 family protein [Sphingobium nicotianae]|uniref:Uncharacterized protein n=1 Tax=Sphingobium nicotianae TaxID=2782607 RepID=A0A9X1IQ15_9SPHN|nr:DUF6886 family protein [Sphingobium nicotianae]MBT2186374.1 hypothetical protein [Sphingobium nicotianae]
MKPALFHFSEDGKIARFTPRGVAVPTKRAPGMAWLNGPLVWAIDDWHQPLYLFPRECPRILAWPTDATDGDARARFWPDADRRMIAWVEAGWMARIARATIHRYALPAVTFEALDDAGMWVSRALAVPDRVDALDDLPARLAACDVDLRPVADLRALAPLWGSGLHVSGLRLRNAPHGWP